MKILLGACAVAIAITFPWVAVVAGLTAAFIYRKELFR
jgi:hypothetical protein